MKLLVLGGTRFLGRHLVQQAIAQGHAVTLMHRGISNTTLFPEAQHLIADRNADLSVLSSGSWDVAIDTNAYVPRHVRTVAAALQGRVGVYQLISSISVYASFSSGPDENSARAVLADPTTETVDGASYGGLKALCEDAALAAFPDRCLIARPGLIGGPFDPTGRFTWWMQRVARGPSAGPILVPGEPSAQVQFIDARDCAAWLLRQAAAATTGTFNLTGPNTPLTMAAFLQSAKNTLHNSAPLQWLDEAFLLAQEVKPWTDLPLWLSQEDAGLHQTQIQRAVATGLSCRPLAQTIADTAAWAANEADKPGIGLPAAREAELLAAWLAR
jgi:2'-hydroxyisoflavone reductase